MSLTQDKWELADNEKAGEKEAEGFYERTEKVHGHRDVMCWEDSYCWKGMKNPSGETGMLSCVGEMDYSTGCSHLRDLLGMDPLLKLTHTVLVGF